MESHSTVSLVKFILWYILLDCGGIMADTQPGQVLIAKKPNWLTLLGRTVAVLLRTELSMTSLIVRLMLMLMHLKPLPAQWLIAFSFRWHEEAFFHKYRTKRMWFQAHLHKWICKYKCTCYGNMGCELYRPEYNNYMKISNSSEQEQVARRTII